MCRDSGAYTGESKQSHLLKGNQELRPYGSDISSLQKCESGGTDDDEFGDFYAC